MLEPNQSPAMWTMAGQGVVNGYAIGKAAVMGAAALLYRGRGHQCRVRSTPSGHGSSAG